MPKYPQPWREVPVPLYGGKILAYRKPKPCDVALSVHGAAVSDSTKDDGSCTQCAGEAGRVVYVLGWFDGRTSTLAHELAHASLFILNRAGIDCRESSGEAFAYLLGALMADFLGEK